MDTITLAMQHYSTLMQTLPISPASWITVATIAVLTVILVAVLVYMISSITNSETAKVWSRFQIYEAFLSLLLIVVFGSLSYLFFLSPQAVFSSVHLVPSTCTSASQLYTLAACDLGLFNNASFSFGRYVFYATYISALVGGIVPTINTYPIGNAYINFSITLPSLFPTGITQLLGWMYGLLLVMLIFNQIQLIMLAGAIFFLSFFLTIGLVARTLGFLRSFGGAMIAFGIGLGIIYPLLVSMTYGYVDVAANLACIQTTSCALTTLGSSIWTTIFSQSSSVPAAVGTFFDDVGYIFLGLTLVPLLNIAIVDAFIIDFSSAIGERMSFGQLFSSLI